MDRQSREGIGGGRRHPQERGGFSAMSLRNRISAHLPASFAWEFTEISTGTRCRITTQNQFRSEACAARRDSSR